MGRGAGWMPEHDVFIVQAYISVSEDPIQGADQQASTFWKKVHDAFATMSGTMRTPEACRSRYAKIQRLCVKFNAMYLMVKGTGKSGWNEDMYIENATKMHNERYPRDPFTYRKCWEVLHMYPKWNGGNVVVKSNSSCKL